MQTRHIVFIFHSICSLNHSRPRLHRNVISPYCSERKASYAISKDQDLNSGSCALELISIDLCVRSACYLLSCTPPPRGGRGSKVSV